MHGTTVKKNGYSMFIQNIRANT